MRRLTPKPERSQAITEPIKQVPPLPEPEPEPVEEIAAETTSTQSEEEKPSVEDLERMRFLTTSQAFRVIKAKRGYTKSDDHFRQKDRETDEALQDLGLRRMPDEERLQHGKLKSNKTPSYENLKVKSEE